MYQLHYDDGEWENVDLACEKFRIIGGVTLTATTNDGKNKSTGEETDEVGQGNSGKKRRRVHDTSEEEMEFDAELSDEDEGDDDDDSGSEYKGGGDDDSMDSDESLKADEDSAAKGVNEDDWLESEDEAPTKKKKAKVLKKVTITRVGVDSAGSNTVSPTPFKTSGTTSKVDFSSFASSQTPSTNQSKASSSSAKPKAITQSQNSPMPTQKLDSKMAAVANRIIPKPLAGVVNVAGSHTHNHLKFFNSQKKDIHRNLVGTPNYSPRTLTVDYKEIARVNASGKVTPAQQQWWEIKAQYADTVLFFKTGKVCSMAC